MFSIIFKPIFSIFLLIFVYLGDIFAFIVFVPTHDTIYFFFWLLYLYQRITIDTLKIGLSLGLKFKVDMTICFLHVFNSFTFCWSNMHILDII
jgi:hypothetical protein